MSRGAVLLFAGLLLSGSVSILVLKNTRARRQWEPKLESINQLSRATGPTFRRAGEPPPDMPGTSGKGPPTGGSSGRAATGPNAPRKRAWDRAFLASLRQAAQGSPIRFELVASEMASGRIGYVARTNGQVIYLSGTLTEPESGGFFFQKQTQPGVAGEFVGLVEFPGTERAYRIEPSGPDGAPELVEHALGEVICYKLPAATNATTNQTAEIPPLKPGNFPNLPPPGYQNGISALESLHGATAVVYLDFQGGYTPTWGGVTYQRPAVSNDQIREVWQRVAEDFMPFNINVTTDLRVFQNAPEGGRQRVIITPTTTVSPDAGGVAYIGSFNYTGDMPCWAFETSGKACAEVCSHEIGHTLGLNRHEGQDVNGVHVEYYGGQGSGEVGWAPLMGVGYYQNVSEWSRGDYLYANNQQDELEMIASGNNNVAYRPDDTGDTLATSRYLELYPGYSAGAEGVIERTADTDAFRFTTTGGAVWLRADPVTLGPNLALAVSLYDANDIMVASNCPQDTLWAALSNNLAAGTYTFRVTGAGRGDPLTNGFSNYGSLGYYSITGSVANADLPDRFAIPEHSTNGAIVGIIAPCYGGSDPLFFAIASGNDGGTFAIDNAGVLTVATNSLLDYAALANRTQLTVQFQLFVNITDLLNPSLSETNRRVVVAVMPVLKPPVITQQPQNLTVPAALDATFTVGVNADHFLFDPLNYQWFFNGTAIAAATTFELVITNAQAQNAGDYAVVITNFEGAVTSAVAALTVTPASPQFILEPASQSVLVGGSAGFQALAVGSEPISYQWQFNGTNLDGQTNANLVLATADFSDMGGYQVVVSNVAGKAVSAQAQLTVTSLLAWGWNDYGQTNVPAGLGNVVEISAGAQHNLALFRDGTVIAWGSGEQTNVPVGLTGVVQVAAGGSHSLALKSDGTVMAWGEDGAGQTDLPSELSNVVRVAAGGSHSLGLLADGTVVAWGLNTNGQCNVPFGLSNVVEIAAGDKHSLALRADGLVSAWGDNSVGQLSVPLTLTNVVSVAAGARHSLALTAQGQLVAWGDDTYGQLSVPGQLNSVAAIVAGGFHNLALQADGTMIGWGAGQDVVSGFPLLGQATVPEQGTNVAAVAAGLAHSLVLRGNGPPFITEPPVSHVGYRDFPVAFRAEATGALPLSYQWQFAGINLPGATAQELGLTNATNTGDYQVVVSNALGAVTSSPARFELVDGPPSVRVQPLSQTGYLSGHLQLQVVADGSRPLSYQWFFNGVLLQGATNSVLTLGHLVLAQAGAYSVVVSNDAGAVSSAKAIVQVATVAAWGDDSNGQTNVPRGLAGVVQVAGGDYHSLALRADGSVVAWGATPLQGYDNNDYGQTAVPAEVTNAVAIAAGAFHSLALRADGTVVAWGAGYTNSGFGNQYGQSMVPAGLRDVVDIAAGSVHSVALKSDGKVVVWGASARNTTFFVSLAVPPEATNVVAIVSRDFSISALKADGAVVNWGEGGTTSLGAGYVALAPGVGLSAAGYVVSSVGIGSRFFGPGNLFEVACGGMNQLLARRSDGSVVSWGNTNLYGLGRVPSGLTNAIGIGCGHAHSLVALGDGSIQITRQPWDREVDLGGKTLFRVLAGGAPRLRFQWRFNGVDLIGATNFWMFLSDLQSTNAGGYSVVVSNPSQTITSRVATLSVRVPTLSWPGGAALDAPGLAWSSTGDVPWFGQTNITHDGLAAAQSGAIGDSQQSTVQTVVSGPGTLSFWWKVSSEEWFDFLNFSINGQLEAAISGEVDWQFKQFGLPEGTNLLSWTYIKDPTVSGGLDAGWLAEVTVLTNAPIVVQQPSSVTVPVGTNISLSILAQGAPPLWYQWLKNGTNVAGATDSLLTITRATRHDSGQYAVAVSNPGGTTLSSNADLLVRVPQSLGSPGWLPQVGFTLISRDADGAPLLPQDLAGIEAQSSTNLINWASLTNSLTLTNGALLLVDPQAANYAERFYRIIEH